MSYAVDRNNTINAEATTKKPAMTSPMQNKVLGSSNAAAKSEDWVDQGLPKEGVGLTSMKPIGSGRTRGY